MTADQPPPRIEASASAPAEALPEALFLAPEAVPRRKNQMMAAGLAVVAILVLVIAVTLVLLIRYENLPSLFSYFT